MWFGFWAVLALYCIYRSIAVEDSSTLSIGMLLLGTALMLVAMGGIAYESGKQMSAYDRACQRMNGYVESGKNIRLCIEYETGRILRPEHEVER